MQSPRLHSLYAEPTFTAFQTASPNPSWSHRWPMKYGSYVAQLQECDERGLPGFHSCPWEAGAQCGESAATCLPSKPLPHWGPTVNDLFLPGIPPLGSQTRSRSHLPKCE